MLELKVGLVTFEEGKKSRGFNLLIPRPFAVFLTAAAATVVVDVVAGGDAGPVTENGSMGPAFGLDFAP